MERFLRENGVEFVARDVSKDEEAFSELERLGTMTTPVAVVNGSEMVVGFDREKLRHVLGL